MTEKSIIPEGFKFCECGKCNEIIPRVNKRGELSKFKHGHNLRIIPSDSIPRRKGSASNLWKGGKTIGSDGYIFIFIPNHPYADCHGYVREHRLVMEKHLERYLLPSEIVHHKNGNKTDNRIDNLELFVSNGVHMSGHMRGNKFSKKRDMSNRRCCDCGSSDTWRRNWLRDKDDPTKLRCLKCGLRYRKLIRKLAL